ncbi:MAG: 50S ribosome-binding GTPase [Desulfobacteraceae bacterium]
MKQSSGAILDSSSFAAETVKHPGLTPGAEEIHNLAEQLHKKLNIFDYKQLSRSLWVVFMGGTGTGKSTLFNAFCGKRLSETGVERPITSGPIVYAHRECPIENHFPFSNLEFTRRAVETLDSNPAFGAPGQLLVLEHDRDDWSHLVLADTPDLDSVQVEHRQIAEDLYLLSDAVMFITSQEKYADEVPYLFLLRVLRENKPYFLLLNKAEEQITQDDLLKALRNEEVPLKMDRIALIPYTPSHPSQKIPEYAPFRNLFVFFSRELSKERSESLRQTAQSRLAYDLENTASRLTGLIEQENKAAQHWLNQLEALSQQTSQDFISEQKERFAQKSHEHLRTEVRKLFAKYDVLARPRRFVKELFLTPFRFLGFLRKGAEDAQKEALSKVRQKIDLTPVQSAMEKYNRLVLEKLSPSDEAAPLFRTLRQPGVALTDEEIRVLIWTEQDKLDTWLEKTFEDLSRGIPTSKKWGIYTTSILWGILILAFEAAVGGGFTVLDAALDSALAPFVTKGTVELFAYNEIRKIARELAERYKKGLLTVVHHQRGRYEKCLQSLMTPEETLENLQKLRSRISDRLTA